MKHFIAMAVVGLGTAAFATDSAHAEHDREFRTSYYNNGYGYNTYYAPQVNYDGCYTTQYRQPYNTQYRTPYGNPGYNNYPYHGGYNTPSNYGAYRPTTPYTNGHYHSGYGWYR